MIGRPHSGRGAEVERRCDLRHCAFSGKTREFLRLYYALSYQQVTWPMRVFAIVASALALIATAAAAEPDGFVIEAVLATPGADAPVERETAIEIEIDGYIVIISRSGQLIRKDGPYSGPAGELLDAIFAPGDDDLGNPVLSSLLELAEVSRASTELVGGVRGALLETEVHPTAITTATTAYCLARGTLPAFYVSQPPVRDEPVTIRSRVSPQGFLQAKWPVGVTTLPWPADWPAPVEGRYIWTLGSRGPSALWIRLVEDPPRNLAERAALYYDMRCTSQAVALFRAMLDGAARR